MLPSDPIDMPTLISTECFICITHDSNDGFKLSLKSRSQVPESSTSLSESTGKVPHVLAPRNCSSTRRVTDSTTVAVEVLKIISAFRTNVLPTISGGVCRMNLMGFACPLKRTGGLGRSASTRIDGVYAGNPSIPSSSRPEPSFCRSINGRLALGCKTGDLLMGALLQNFNALTTLVVLDKGPNICRSTAPTT